MLRKKLVLSADSKEVQREYYIGQIKLLEEELSQLNLMDNPHDIRAICERIIMIKALLQKNKADRK